MKIEIYLGNIAFHEIEKAKRLAREKFHSTGMSDVGLKRTDPELIWREKL